MKALTACILAMALIFRAAPICAAPSQVEVVAPMPGCKDALNHHDEQPGQKGDEAARACHPCAFPPVVNTTLTQPPTAAAVPTNQVIEQLTGSALEPPTPPPRNAARTNFQHSIGV